MASRFKTSIPELMKQRPYTAYGAARRLWSCRDEEILIEGPAGTGKTRAALEKVHFCAMKYPGARFLITRKTRESMTHTVLVTFEEKVVPEKSPILSGPQRNLRQVYKYPGGSEIVVGGLDNTLKIMSSEYDLIVIFEATEASEEDYENLTTRLRNGIMPYQQIICDCNPGAPSHWLNKRASAGRMTRLKSTHEDNPVYYDNKRAQWRDIGLTYIRKLDRLTGARKLRLRFGKWAAQEGMVYEKYDELVHCIPRFDPPPHWPRFRVIDFGYKNPFVCQWWALDEDRRMYLYREIYHTHRTVQEHAKKIKELSGDEKYEVTLADHDAEGRATLENEGIYTLPAFKSIRPGIDAVSLRLNVQGDGRPRLLVMRDAIDEIDGVLDASGLPTCTMHEWDGYVYKKDQDGKLIKEEPIDLNNHGMDCVRYGVAYVDSVAAMSLPVVMEPLLVVS